MKLYKIWKDGKIVESPYPGLYVGVKTTKVFGRLTHKSGAKRKNLVFFHFWDDAVEAGMRPCKGCKPDRFLMKNCGHMPFGLTGGYALDLKKTPKGNIRILCALCSKFFGYAKQDKKGRLRWGDGFVVPHEKVLAGAN